MSSKLIQFFFIYSKISVNFVLKFKNKIMNAYILPLGVIGPQQLILIVIIVLLLFGGKKIPELMSGLGKGIKEFKKATSEEEDKPKEHIEKKED